MSIPSSSEAVATTARSSPRFNRDSAVCRSWRRQAAVVREHGLVPDPLGQMMRNAFSPDVGY